MKSETGDAVALFTHGFYLWLLRVKSEDCLWVIVKESSKTQCDFQGELNQTTLSEPAQQILKGDKQKKRHLFLLTEALTNFLRLPQVKCQTRLILNKNPRCPLAETHSDFRTRPPRFYSSALKTIHAYTSEEEEANTVLSKKK